ncbi:MAG: DUF898 domain-containing protein, partial [Acidiferrobacterales bacterium]|nr:DUF898 domain-containing protein [Acidiferrobacterales bacterium]
KIWIVNILLTIVTLSLYYPWAKVRNRRYFYANSELEGRNFEYHATGKQLFLGYLIALGLLIAYVVLQNVSPTASGVVFLIFILALPWIIWRSLKFNMRMTSFSNVRFSFDAKLPGAYINFLLLPIVFFVAIYGIPIAAITIAMSAALPAIIIGVLGFLTFLLVIVLGIFLFAYLKKRNTHYMLNGYRYGQGQFLTEVEVKPFAIILLKTTGLAILLFVGFMFLAGIIVSLSVGLEQMMGMQQNIEDPEAAAETAGLMFLIIGPLYFGFILVSFFVLAYSYTRQRAYILDNSVLDEKVTFASTLQAWPFAWIMITNFLLVVFTLGLGLPWAKVRMARHMLENTQVDASVGFDDYVTQQRKEQSALGEQIGDAFDVDVGVGF